MSFTAVARSRAAVQQLSLSPALIVGGAVVFNAVLAVVNGNVTSLTQAPVIGAEVLFVAAAHAVALSHLKREMTPWYALLALFVFFAVVRSIWSQTVDVKYLRDVMIIPTFVVLGMTFDARRLYRVFVIIQIITCIFLLLEALDLSLFSSTFKIQDYYINTRGYSSDDFWNKSSNLFVSATRPDGSFLSIIDLHRLSSIFLEPVSLGNYCMVVVAFLCACWREIPLVWRWFLAVTTAVAMVGCDGRLAIASVGPMVVCAFFAARASRPIALLYVPAVLALAFILVAFAHFQPGGDDFPSRIAHTVTLLGNYNLLEFFGLSDAFMSTAVDSGIAYLITTQSIFLVVALLLTIALGAPANRPDQKRIIHAAMIYIALNMMVSYALLTIKTAAVLWFTFGSLLGRQGRLGQAESNRVVAVKKTPHRLGFPNITPLPSRPTSGRF